MDERIEKAFEVANYFATLSNQRRIILEEFNQKLFFYINGATFIINPTLINYTKSVLDLGHTTDVPFVDSNECPVIINDVQEFFNNITEKYFTSLNVYAAKFGEISTKRNVKDILDL
jgi:hypothetical protein